MFHTFKTGIAIDSKYLHLGIITFRLFNFQVNLIRKCAKKRDLILNVKEFPFFKFIEFICVYSKNINNFNNNVWKPRKHMF